MNSRTISRREYYEANKEISLAQGKRWRENNPDRYKELTKRTRTKVRMDCLTAYSGGTPHCRCCGEDDVAFLCLDHINEDGAERRRNGEPKGGVAFFTYLRRNNYPEGIQVLCYNCNNAKKNLGTCPHNNKE